MQAQKSVIRRLERELEKAGEDVQRMRKLADLDAGSQQSLADAEIKEAAFKEQLAEARLKEKRLQMYQDVAEAIGKAAIRAQQAETLRAEAAAKVSSTEAKMKLAEAELENTIVRSPIDGVVLKIETYPGERISDEPILQIGDLRQMHVVAEVYETDVRLVKLGQRATIDSPALAEPISGVVEEIGLLIDKNDVLDIDPAAPVDSRVVEVRVKLDESKTAARFVDLQVRVKIDLETSSRGGNR